jgi:hypothetical protein
MCDACRTKVIGVAHDSRVGRRLGAAQISRPLRQRSLLVVTSGGGSGIERMSEACHCH